MLRGKFSHAFVSIADFFHNHQVTDAGAPGMGQGSLIGGRVIAFHCLFQGRKPRHHVAGAVIALQLHIAPTAGQEDPAMGSDGRARLRGIAAIGVGVGDVDGNTVDYTTFKFKSDTGREFTVSANGALYTDPGENLGLELDCDTATMNTAPSFGMVRIIYGGK